MRTPDEIDAENGNAKPWITGEDRGESERTVKVTQTSLRQKIQDLDDVVRELREEPDIR